MIEIVAPVDDAEADRALLNDVRAYLARHEAVNSIQLSAFMAADAFDPATAVLVARHESGIAGVVALTGAFNLLLSHIEDDAAILALAHAVIERNIAIPGVMGPVAASRAFADAWVARTGGARSPGMAQRILATSTVRLPPGVAGSWRHMDGKDQPLLLEWFTSFAGEAEQVGLAEARGGGSGHGDPGRGPG